MADTRDESAEEARRRFLAGELIHFRHGWEIAHRVEALLQAVKLCDQFGVALPEWASQGVVGLLQDRIDGGGQANAKGGRGANEQDRNRITDEHFARHDVVVEIIDRVEAGDPVLLRRGRDEADVLYGLIPHTSMDDIFEAAAALMHEAGDPAAKSAETIRQSFYRVRKDLHSYWVG